METHLIISMTLFPRKEKKYNVHTNSTALVQTPVILWAGTLFFKSIRLEKIPTNATIDISYVQTGT